MKESESRGGREREIVEGGERRERERKRESDRDTLTHMHSHSYTH